MGRRSRLPRWCGWILRRKWSTTATAEFCPTCCGSWRFRAKGGVLDPAAFSTDDWRYALLSRTGRTGHIYGMGVLAQMMRAGHIGTDLRKRRHKRKETWYI